ncbi:MAG: hypothetical protein ACXV2E_05365 [Halobacteriota archaeon]
MWAQVFEKYEVKINPGNFTGEIFGLVGVMRMLFQMERFRAAPIAERIHHPTPLVDAGGGHMGS